MSMIKSAVMDAVVAALPLALVYFSGWAYLSSYLAIFGIDATQVNIPITTVLVYAFIPLKSWSALAFLAAVALVVYAVSLLKNLPDWVKNLGVPAAAAAVVLLLFVVKHVAERRAAEMADHVWQGDKSHTVVELRPAGQQSIARELYNSCIGGRRLRQIIGLGETMYLLCRSARRPENYSIMFVISKDREIAYYADRTRVTPEPDQRDEN